MPAAQPQTARWLDLEPGWLFEHIRDAVVVVEPRTRLIRLWNPAAERLFGYPVDHILDRPVDHVMDGLALDVARLQELSGRTASGASVWIEASTSTLGGAGNDELILLVARDVTDRRRLAQSEAAQRRAQREIEQQRSTERALIASEARLHAALEAHTFVNDASRELAISLDYTTTLQIISRLPLPRLADLCIVQAVDDELMFDAVAVAHFDAARDVQLQTALDRQDATGSSERRPATRLVLNGATHTRNSRPGPDFWAATGLHGPLLDTVQQFDPWSVLFLPLVGRTRVLGFMLLGSPAADGYEPTAIAMAERLARRCALALEHATLYRTSQQAIAARDQFLSIASHELRAPLTRIKTHAETLLLAHNHGQLEPERLVWSAERINAAADRLAALTKDVLDVSRLRGGHIPFRPSSVDLAELLRDLEPRLAEHLDKPRQLVLDLTSEPCPVLVDQDRVDQIMANLLDNAAKYSPEGGPVTVRVARVDDGVQLQVRDCGVGLPPGAVDMIFEPFGRAANAEQWNVPGMGLGLHICRMIVERHHGRIWAESEGENRGTTISVWLPFAAASAMPRDDVQERLTNQLTLAVGYCELLATNPELPEGLRKHAVEAMHGAQGAVATLEDLQHLGS